MRRSIETELLTWKNSPIRSPLILRGARQVGKSHVIEAFGKREFSSLLVLNLEFQSELHGCFESLNPKTILQSIAMLTDKEVVPGETLLFIDEIQECPRAILALRYFKEKMPDLHVIAAGSLLEFALQETEYSFPVGRVQFMYLKPLSFREFLWALGKERMLEFLDSVTVAETIDPAVHQRLLDFIRLYFLIGGMPAVVKAYRDRESIEDCVKIQNMILNTYRTDFGKYATKSNHRRLQRVFENAPALVTHRCKYSKIDPSARSGDVRASLDQLNYAGIYSYIYATAADGIPLRFDVNDKKFKLLFLDIGLLQRATQVSAQTIWSEGLLQINSGQLAEQFVGQELMAYAAYDEEKRLYFWERKQRTSSAEIDYVVNMNSAVIPIEVKAGLTGRLKSLQLFLAEKKRPLGVRVSSAPLELSDKGILSVPLYLVEQLPRLLKQLL